MFRLPGRIPEDAPDRRGHALGQGQRCPLAVEHRHQFLRQHRVHPSTSQEEPRLALLGRQSQQQMGAAHIAVAQIPGLLPRRPDQFPAFFFISHLATSLPKIVSGRKKFYTELC